MNHCYLLSDLNNDNVISFSHNVSTTVIDIQPYPYNNVLQYKQVNHTHYQWCGPMLLIAEYFARFSKTR